MNKTKQLAKLLSQIALLKRQLDKTSEREGSKGSKTFHWPPKRQYSYLYKFDGRVVNKAEMNSLVKKALGKEWIPSFERFGYYPLPKEACHAGRAIHKIGPHTVEATRQNA